MSFELVLSLYESDSISVIIERKLLNYHFFIEEMSDTNYEEVIWVIGETFHRQIRVQLCKIETSSQKNR